MNTFRQDYVTFPPSSAHIWGSPDGCPAYVHALREYPRTRNDAADEGNVAHELAAQSLPDSIRAGYPVIPCCNDPEMLTHVVTYIRLILTELRSAEGVAKHGVEEKLHLRNIHQHCTGYIDWWWWAFDAAGQPSHISVWDLKYGRGVVEAYRNLQLVAYMSALLRMAGCTPDSYPPSLTLSLHIYQPRASHPDGAHRVWTPTPGEVFALEAQLIEAARIADNPDVFTRSGNHCRYCPARLDCPAARKSAMESIAYIEQPTREQFTPEQLGRELVILERAAEAIAARLSATRAEVEKHMGSGEQISTWHYRDTVSRMYWTSPTAGEMLEAMGFKGILKPPAPCTPKQAIDAGVPESVVLSMAKRTRGKKLTRTADDWAAREIKDALSGASAKPQRREFEVWSEGYAATGEHGAASLQGVVSASSFKEACDLLFKGNNLYDPKTMRLWGCKLFDNQSDAIKSFG